MVGLLRRVPWSVGMVLLLALPSAAGHAQTPQTLPAPLPDSILRGLQQPPVERPELPKFERSGPEPGFVLPPLPPSEEGNDRLSSQLRVRVREIRLIGNSVFSQEQLAGLTAPYENRVITSEELHELRDKLTLYYVDRGYINSGAVIPDQDVADGVITLRIVEGELTQVEVGGNRRLRSAYISKRVALSVERPLNLAPLQAQLQLLQQDPLIERVNAELAPGDRPGEAALRVQVAEARPYFATIGIDNGNPPSSGSERAGLSVGHRNFSGWGDTLALGVGLTEGSDDFTAQYRLPLSARDTALALLYSRTKASVIEEPFQDLDIESDTETFGISLTHPLLRTPNRQLSTGLSLQRRHNQTRVLGIPFAFSPGAPEGRSTVSVLRWSLDWLERSREQVIAARSTFSFGLDALGATVGIEPDGRFLVWLAQFQWATRLGERGSQAIVRMDMQLAVDKLPPMEQFAVGGARTVRGYRENQLVRDNAVVISGELRTPLSGRAGEPIGLQLAAFADYGRAWNHGEASPEPRYVSSVGLGVHWDPHPRLHAELYWGQRLRKVRNPGSDLQDQGIHFAVSWQAF